MWSDWQTGPIHTVNWVKVGTAFRDYGQSFNGDWNMGDSSSITQQLVAANLEDDVTPYPYGSVLDEVRGMYLRLVPESWKYRRDSIPAALSSLELGKDWDQIPDRPGEYVEYENDGPNTPLSTRGPSLLFKSGTKGGSLESGGTREGDGAWALGVVTGVVAPPPYSGSGHPEVPSAQWPGLGVVFATGGPDVLVNTDYQAYFPDITGAEYAFVSPLMTGAPPLFGDHAAAFFQMVSTPTLTYQMPRWRYWIPRKPPLRLRQRDDNLFLNAGRTRNRSSRHTTNRLRSYD